MEDRRLAVLRAIVEDYVEMKEPVGSKALADRHGLGVSSATIRNDMAALEDEGLISAPHTSAGRIPTDKGYRLFVDKLSTVKPLSNAERQAIHTFLDQAVDLDDIMMRTVRLLSQLTKQVALIQYPLLGRSSVRHIELLSVSNSRLLMIVIADTGRLEQRTIETGIPLSESALAHIRAKINEQLDGQLFSDVPDKLLNFAAQFEPGLTPAINAIISTLLESIVRQPDERVVVSGTAHLARSPENYTATFSPILEALEEQVVLMRLLGETQDADALSIRIGSENPVEEFRSASIVTTGYGAGEQSVGHVGVLGPTRMDYPGSIAAVRAVARYVGKIVMENQ